MGIAVLALLPKNRCIGDEVIPSFGVFLQFNMAILKSYLLSLHFRSKVFIDFIVTSALPLACWWCGDVVLCVKLHVVANSLNVSQQN